MGAEDSHPEPTMDVLPNRAPTTRRSSNAIDVEGAEYKVIEGAAQFLQSNSPKIAMEYVAPHRGNKEHTKAHHLLLEMGYRAYLIDKDGYLQNVANINAYLEDEHLESDNIVYSKSLK